MIVFTTFLFVLAKLAQFGFTQHRSLSINTLDYPSGFITFIEFTFP